MIKFIKIIRSRGRKSRSTPPINLIQRCCSSEPIIITEQLPSATNEPPHITPSAKRASIAPNLSIQNTRHNFQSMLQHQLIITDINFQTLASFHAHVNVPRFSFQ